jgi:hypothetical protein
MTPDFLRVLEIYKCVTSMTGTLPKMESCVQQKARILTQASVQAICKTLKVTAKV